MDQPGKAANSARGQLNKKNNIISLSVFAAENLVSWDGFGSTVPHQLAHHHTQAESGALLTRFPTEFRGGVHLFIAKPP